MRAKTVTMVVLITASWAAVTSSCSSAPANARGGPRVVRVSCADASQDAATLQQAIDASPAGAVIEIQAGTCLLTRGIALLANRTYTGGSAAGTVLKQDGRMSYVLASQAYAANSSTTGDPLAIRDLTVACDGSGGTNGIVVMNWHADVRRVDVTGCGGSGIVDTNTTANGTAIKNTSVNSRFDDNFITASGRYGFEVHDSGNAVTDGFLTGNQIGSSANDAIHLDNAAGWDISGNHLYKDGQDGIVAMRLYGTTISGNYIEDFGDRQDSGTWYGIALTVQSGGASTIFGNKVLNNRGETAGAKHIYVSAAKVGGANRGGGYLSVTGNIILSVRPDDVGFFFSGSSSSSSSSSGASRLVVASSGNEVAGAGTARKSAGPATITGGI